MDYVLIVEADSSVLTARGDELLADGHEVLTASDDSSARVKLPDARALILGSLGSTPASLRLLRDLRAGQITNADPALPAMTIGADADHELVRHYQAGADLALPSAASPTLVSAGLQSLAARVTRTPQAPIVTIGNLHINPRSRTVTIGERPVYLSNAQYAILRALADTPEEIIPRARLHRALTGSEVILGRPEVAQVSRLRQDPRRRGRHRADRPTTTASATASPAQPARPANATAQCAPRVADRRDIPHIRAMARYASEILQGSRPGPYTDRDASEYATRLLAGGTEPAR